MIGSSSGLEKEGVSKDEFEQACEALGEALGRTNHTIILCSARETTADPYILRGLNNMPGQHQVKLIRPDRNTLQQDSQDPVEAYVNEVEYPNIRFERSECNGGLPVVHLQAIRQCDAVIAIGGQLRGTGTAVYSAEVMEKAVIALPSFGGAAKIAWEDFKLRYDDREVHELQRSGNDSAWAERLVKTALVIAKRNPFKRIKQIEAAVTAVFGVLSLVLWVLLFLGEFSQLKLLTAPLTLVLMLMLISIVGTLLRSALRALGVLSSEWPTNLVLEGFVGLVFAVLIFMLSEATNLFLSAQPVQLEGLYDIQRVGLGLSFLVLMAVLFLEGSWRRIWAAVTFLNR